MQPAQPLPGEDRRPALFLSLHGAGVQALGQSRSYSRKTWGHVVAPTNRRPFGFDWEDWGRLDAIEVLERAQAALGTDPLRVYLTGHSMGGHGTWHLGATFPDRFAAIGPSAGWISFWSYGGSDRLDEAAPLERMLMRATTASDTIAPNSTCVNRSTSTSATAATATPKPTHPCGSVFFAHSFAASSRSPAGTARCTPDSMSRLRPFSSAASAPACS